MQEVLPSKKIAPRFAAIKNQLNRNEEIFFTLLFTATIVNAQVTTSSLTGTILESNVQPAIGTSIKATHVPTGTNYSTLTNESGRFTISNMRVEGSYVALP